MPQVVVALTTPFREYGAVDERALAAHVAWLVEQGVDALMPCGTTGEGPLLEPDEVEVVVRVTLDAAGGRAAVPSPPAQRVCPPSCRTTSRSRMQRSSRTTGG